jgi:hypothetical protein
MTIAKHVRVQPTNVEVAKMDTIWILIQIHALNVHHLAKHVLVKQVVYLV